MTMEKRIEGTKPSKVLIEITALELSVLIDDHRKRAAELDEFATWALEEGDRRGANAFTRLGARRYKRAAWLALRAEGVEPTEVPV